MASLLVASLPGGEVTINQSNQELMIKSKILRIGPFWICSRSSDKYRGRLRRLFKN